jgi:type IV pilus biogenesis protein CpaD/CtpE
MRAVFLAAAVASLAACGQPATTTEAPVTTTEAPPPTVIVLTETDARSRIEADGYTNVTGLVQNPDGSWSATGTRDGAPTQLTVGESGVTVVTTP